MALAIVEEDHGRDIAMEIARRLVVYMRRPGHQTQFSAALNAQADGHACARGAGVAQYIRGRWDQVRDFKTPK